MEVRASILSAFCPHCSDWLSTYLIKATEGHYPILKTMCFDHCQSRLKLASANRSRNCYYVTFYSDSLGSPSRSLSSSVDA
jgi:hypothetical protein